MRYWFALAVALVALPAHALVLHGRTDAGGRITVRATRHDYGVFRGTWRCRGACPVRRARLEFQCVLGSQIGILENANTTCYWAGDCAGRGVANGQLICDETTGFYLK